MFLRTSFKLITILIIASALIVTLLWVIYKPIYSVTFNGEIIGYCKDRSELQKKINQYIANGDNTNVAFVQIDSMPEYKVCFQKKDIVTTDEEIFTIITGTGTTFYKYYAMLKNGEEVLYLPNFEEAEQVIETLKVKPDYEQQGVSFVQKYEMTPVEYSTTDEAVEKLYTVIEKPVVATKTKSKTSTGTANTSKVTNTGTKVEIGLNLIRPVSGTLTSRFGGRRGGTHTGLDIATSKGTTIVAAAGGTVTFAGWKGSYGNLVIISHGDGVQTYYAHCNSIDVGVGQTVSQGQAIAKVGSTGNSSGPHLHLEVRVNGVAQNPQNYVY